jgi:hypothetical protein
LHTDRRTGKYKRTKGTNNLSSKVSPLDMGQENEIENKKESLLNQRHAPFSNSWMVNFLEILYYILIFKIIFS